MSGAYATKLTKGGQTTIPKEIRQALGMRDESRVYWQLKDGSAVLTAEPPVPNAVSSPEEFWDGIDLALNQASQGRVHEARGLSDELRRKYGLS